MTDEFQTLNDIKVNQDYFIVLASDKLMYSRTEQVAQAVQAAMESASHMAPFVYSELPITPNSDNSIGYSGGQLYLLSSGSVFRMDGKFSYQELDPITSANPMLEVSDVGKILPMPDTSSFIVLDRQNRMSGVKYTGGYPYAMSTIGDFGDVRSVNTSPRGTNPSHFYVAYNGGYAVYDAGGEFSCVTSYSEPNKTFCAVG